ncbi:MAG: hypothetical protein KKE44_02400 [Proteobacteria bacterium]|nr:hypothetical protein [Pseudomonadota bacterium]MBU1581577.1 hypothetical protein [Pseudomonadota bacterium]
MEFFEQYHITAIGIIFLITIFSMTFLTYKDKKWVRKNYKKQDIIALGFGITCYGLSSDQGAPKKHKGFLLIHRHGLLFKSRFSNTLFDIPGNAIQKAYPATSHKGAKLYQSAVKIDFLTPENSTDTIAFKLAYPAQWIKIIGKSFLSDSLQQA